MSSSSGCAAIFAGLLGDGAFRMTEAGKVTLFEGELGPAQLFALGCVGGVLLSGVATVIVSGLARREREDDEFEMGPADGSEVGEELELELDAASPDAEIASDAEHADVAPELATEAVGEEASAEPKVEKDSAEPRAVTSREARRPRHMRIEASPIPASSAPSTLSVPTEPRAKTVTTEGPRMKLVPLVPATEAGPAEANELPSVASVPPVAALRPRGMDIPTVSESAPLPTLNPEVYSLIAQRVPDPRVTRVSGVTRRVVGATTMRATAARHMAQPAEGTAARPASQPLAEPAVPQVTEKDRVQTADGDVRTSVVPVPAADAPASVMPEQAQAEKASPVEASEGTYRKKTLRERLAARAADVASVLGERIGGQDMLDDLPVITRADGSVGDVGTSWWHDALGSTGRQAALVEQHTDPRPVEEALGATGALPEVVAAPAVSIPPATAPAASAAAGEPDAGTMSARQRAMAISRIVPTIERGVYPARRDPSELDSEDLWDASLKAMQERLAVQQAVPVFSDEVGGSDTIDEPAGLEGSTSFIPFKKPAGHPEVVDAESYVEYLIDEEFSHNSSQAVRRTSRDYLKVIRGGSQKMRAIAPSTAKHAYAPKHFAETRELLAKEA